MIVLNTLRVLADMGDEAALHARASMSALFETFERAQDRYILVNYHAETGAFEPYTVKWEADQ